MCTVPLYIPARLQCGRYIINYSTAHSVSAHTVNPCVVSWCYSPITNYQLLY